MCFEVYVKNYISYSWWLQFMYSILYNFKNFFNQCTPCCLQNLTQTPCIESVVVERSKKGRLSTLTCKGDSDLDSSSGGEDCDVETPIDLVSHQKMSFQFYYSWRFQIKFVRNCSEFVVGCCRGLIDWC